MLLAIDFKRALRLFVATVAVVLTAGCAINMKVPLKDQASSVAKFVIPTDAAAVTLFFQDARAEDNKANLLTGRIPMQLTVANDKPFEAFQWIATNTVNEMVARGLPVKLGADNKGPNTVTIKRIHIENRRVSGFSPFETFTSLRADVESGSGKQPIAVFIKRGKVPVWSFDEVIDPTYNAPLGLVVKEFAAKLNQILYNAKFSDAQVDALTQKINTESVNYFDVHELGFSNNQRAIPHLVKLSTHDDDEVRQGARSGLGILRATDQFKLLTSQAEMQKDDWEDRAIALKAIGDFGSPEARDYLQKTRNDLEKLTDEWSVRAKALIDLYLN